MLQNIREKSQGWIAWIIVSAVCITFALWGVHSYLYSNAQSQVVAKVNGVKISQQMLESMFNRLRRQQSAQLGSNYNLSQKQSRLLKQVAMKSLVSNLVLSQATVKNGFRAGPDLVENAIATMPVFQVHGMFSSTRFEQVLTSMLFSQEEFFEQLRQTIITNQFKVGMAASEFALPFETDRAIQLVNQKRDLGYVVIPAERFFNQITVSKKEAMDYYKAHQDAFSTKEAVSIEYLELSVPQLMQKIHPTEQQLQQYYKANIATYTIPTQWQLAHIFVPVPMHASQKEVDQSRTKIDAIAKEIQAGKSFETFAQQFATGMVQNSSYPWATAAEMNDSVSAVLPNLKHIGDVSNVIQTQQGFEIIKLLGKKPSKIRPFAEVKDNVSKAYRQQQAEQQFSNLNDELANQTYEDPDTLNTAAKKLALTIQSTDLFTKEGEHKGLTKNPQIVQAAFSEDVLMQHNNSDPINLGNNSVIVLRIKKHRPSAVKAFDQVEAQIMTHLKTDAADKKAADLGVKLLAAMQKGESPEAVMQKNNLRWNVKKNVSLRDRSLNPTVLGMVFQMAPPSTQQSVTLQSKSLDNGDFVIVALNKAVPGKVSALPQSQRKLFSKGDANGLGVLEYQLFISQTLKDAKIKYYKQNDIDPADDAD
ncbi:MAG: SurA N-terminal domain-containing protein [Gammaproteobacteria bacterium]|nr:SurA N-terminal domain-containing protein [Gammaproteobacteria bacterium]